MGTPSQSGRWRKIVTCGGFFCLGFGLFQAFVPQAGPAKEASSVVEESATPITREVVSSVKKVQAVVEKQNDAVAAEREQFQNAGWEFVSAEEPDPRIMNLDPAALLDKEEQMQTHLQTNTFSGEKLDKLRELALAATTDKTRYVAIESLGRSFEPRAQKLLMRLFEEIDDPASQGQIAQYIRPQSLNDETAGFLFSKLNDNRIQDPLRKQLAASLAAAAVMQAGQKLNAELPADVIARVPTDLQHDFETAYRALTGGRHE